MRSISRSIKLLMAACVLIAGSGGTGKADSASNQTQTKGSPRVIAQIPLIARLTGRVALQVKNSGARYFYLIENNFANENRLPRVLVAPYSPTGPRGQLYNTLNPVYDPTGRWLVFCAIQQTGATPDPDSADSYGIILLDTLASSPTPINITAPLPQFTRARCQDPHWSPDGTKIIFQTNTNAGAYTLHVLNVNLNQPTPTATEAPNSPTFLSGANPLLLSDGSIVYVTKPASGPNRVTRYQTATGSVPLPLPNDTQGTPFTASYYVNPYGSGLIYTVNRGDGTNDQLATFNLTNNQTTLLEPAINTATDNSDPADAVNKGLLLFSRVEAGPYHLFVALPGSSLTPQRIDLKTIPVTASLLGASYTP